MPTKLAWDFLVWLPNKSTSCSLKGPPWCLVVLLLAGLYVPLPLTLLLHVTLIIVLFLNAVLLLLLLFKVSLSLLLHNMLAENPDRSETWIGAWMSVLFFGFSSGWVLLPAAIARWGSWQQPAARGVEVPPIPGTSWWGTQLPGGYVAQKFQFVALNTFF